MTTCDECMALLPQHTPDCYHIDCDEDDGAIHGCGASEPRCPACGQPIDYCQGHGPIGDPWGYVILAAHDDDNHKACHELADCRKDN